MPRPKYRTRFDSYDLSFSNGVIGEGRLSANVKSKKVPAGDHYSVSLISRVSYPVNVSVGTHFDRQSRIILGEIESGQNLRNTLEVYRDPSEEGRFLRSPITAERFLEIARSDTAIFWALREWSESNFEEFKENYPGLVAAIDLLSLE